MAAANGNGVTWLVHMTRAEPSARLVPASFAFVQPGAHYDGVYFYAIARDPLARGSAHLLIDRAAYRYGHPAYGWLAWLASGGGRPRAVPYALLLVSLLGLAAAGLVASVLARDLGLSAWWGLSVGVNPGVLFAVTVDTSETVALAFALLAILAWSRGRLLWAGLAVAAGCFTKEPLLLVPVGIVVWEALRIVSGRRSPDLGRRFAAVTAGPLLYAAWIVRCRHVFGVLPASQVGELTFPFSGWVNTLELATSETASGAAQIGMLTPALLVAVGGALLAGAFSALRRRSPLDLIFLALVVLAFCGDWLVLLYPKDLIRTTVLPVALLPFVLGRGRAA